MLVMKKIFYTMLYAGLFARFMVMGTVMAEEPVTAPEQATQQQVAPQQEESVAADVAPEPAAVFDVMEYRVEGNSVLPAITIERVLYPHLGQGKNIEDVEKARADVERSYRDAGYPTVLVDIPEQDVSASVVHLRVTEGRVDKVRVTGARYYSQGRVLEKFPALTQGGVLYLPDVQKGLAEINRSAGRRVTPILRPGKTPGTVDIDFKVDDTLPLHAALELNDRYSGNTSHLRLSGMVRYDNLWQKEHGLTLQYQTAPENTDEASIFSVSYLLPVANSANMLALYAVRSRSEVAAVGDIQVLGDGDIYGVRAIVPLPQQGRYFHSLSIGLIWSASFLGATSQYAIFKASINKPLCTLFISISVQPCLHHLLSTGKMIVLSAEQKTFWQVINIAVPVIAVLLFAIIFQWLRKRKYTK